MMKNIVILILMMSLIHAGCWFDNAGGSKRALLVLTSITKSNPFAPIAPGGLQATPVSSSRIDLTWHDYSDDESGFSIERSAGGDFSEIASVSAAVTSYSDSGLTSGITYYYRLRSYTGLGRSVFSEVASGTTFLSGSGVYYYIRSDATGANDGSDWTNARTALPDPLVRGRCYYVADGSYPGYTFNDPESGALNIIIKKATAANHGPAAGWQSSYGDGTAEFQPLRFTTSYYVLDGQAGTGFTIRGGFQGHVVSILSSGVIVRNCDLDGNFQYDYAGGVQTDGACTGFGIGDESPWYASFVTVEHCSIHDIADDGFQIYNSDRVYVSDNVVHSLYSCGTDAALDGPCFNGHSDSIEIFNLANSEFNRNFIYDTEPTNAALFFGNVADLYGGYKVYCKNIILANNIFYMPRAGFVAYFDEADGIKAYNNIFWGRRQGAYGGLSIWKVKNLDMYNNIILSIYYGHMHDVYRPTQHRGDYNLFGFSNSSMAGEYREQPHDIVNPDPGFANPAVTAGTTIPNPTPADFAIQSGSACIDAGYSGDAVIAIPHFDFSGTERPRGTGIDIGAFEYGP
ncbi:MAG: hypothetical protein A2176_02290 [Spirochaetes bacterium RBG_13_51_14]|nr:MAG: hypothetical protein A2176_02290 [Spirochaetes bacterium RBG_13_51_14]